MSVKLHRRSGWFKWFKRKPKEPVTPLTLLRDIKSAVIVIMCCCAVIAGSTCDIVTVAEIVVELIEEQDEAETDRAMAGGTWI